MYTIEEIKLILQECKELNKPYVFKSLCSVVPKWESFIQHTNDQYLNHRIAEVPSNPYRERFVRGVLFKNPLYLNVIGPKLEWYPEIEGFFNIFINLILLN